MATSDRKIRALGSEQKIVARIRVQHAEGATFQAIAEGLNADGLHAKLGGLWHRGASCGSYGRTPKDAEWAKQLIVGAVAVRGEDHTPWKRCFPALLEQLRSDAVRADEATIGADPNGHGQVRHLSSA
jgi:hypothetical protein